jgi:Zn-dependent protease with chaperone function
VAVVAGLLGWTVIVAVGAPVMLRRAGWNTRRPGLALGLWCSSYVSALLAAVASLGAALAIGLSGRLPDGAHAGVVTTSTVLMLSWVGLVSVGALASLVMARTEPMTADHRRTAALMTLLVTSSAYRREAYGRVAVVFVENDLPAAVSLPGRQPRIVVTSRLDDELTAGQLRAVIEHERAHLVQHHGWIVQLARLNVACLPALPAATQFHRAARLMVELIADDAAARVCGSQDVVQALSAMAALTADEGLLLRARRQLARPVGATVPTGPSGLRHRLVSGRPAQDGER